MHERKMQLVDKVCAMWGIKLSSHGCVRRNFKQRGYSYINVKLSLSLTNWALRHEGVWGSWCIDPLFLDLDTSWRWLVSFTPLPLYSRGKSLRYPLDRRLGGPQSRSGRSGEEKILHPTKTRNSDPSVVQPVASHYIDYDIPAHSICMYMS
jgi:hypothetical protein